MAFIRGRRDLFSFLSYFLFLFWIFFFFFFFLCENLLPLTSLSSGHISEYPLIPVYMKDQLYGIVLCWTVFLTERIPHAGVINSTEFFTFGQRWRIRFADLEFLTQTSLSHIRISIACTPVNKFLMNGNIFGEI